MICICDGDKCFWDAVSLQDCEDLSNIIWIVVTVYLKLVYVVFKPAVNDHRTNWIFTCRHYGFIDTLSCNLSVRTHFCAAERHSAGWGSCVGGRWERMKKLKRKRIMLHIKRFIFLHGMVNTKRCLDAFIIGASFGGLCQYLLPKTKF